MTPTMHAYSQSPVVTPEREAAWQRWADDYVASCIESWLGQGSSRDEVVAAAEIVRAQFAVVDQMDWMTLGRAQCLIANIPLERSSEPTADKGIEMLNALRTSTTSLREDRVLVIGHVLGVTIGQAETLVARVERSQEPDRQHFDTTTLYRYFDASGRLLYVGIAKDQAKRMEQHRYNSKWFRFVDGCATEKYRSRAEAEQAERIAIRDEFPVFNQALNKNNRDAAVAYLFDAMGAVQ